jgi:hypothetical protein
MARETAFRREATPRSLRADSRERFASRF